MPEMILMGTRKGTIVFDRKGASWLPRPIMHAGSRYVMQRAILVMVRYGRRWIMVTGDQSYRGLEMMVQIGQTSLR